MATLPHPTTAWAADGSYHLTTKMPSHLARRGYRATWPAGAVVWDVVGVPSDAAVPDGINVVQNSLNGLLYRRTSDGWLPAKGYPEGQVDMTPAPALAGYAGGYAGGY